FYDSAVGRFVSADTVIPGGTQGYDRYAYVYNNPLRYNDPTGHETQCPDGICENDNNDEDDKLEELKEYVEETLLNNNGQIKKQYTSLQAMLMVMMQAVLLYGNNWNGFLDACSYIFIGVAKHGAGTMLAGHYSSFNGYFDGDSGFHSDFQDDSNQVRHFWAAFADAANPTGDNPNGVASASFGNYFHEIVQDTKSGDDGATVTDYKLSITGIEIAMQAGNQIKSPLALIGVLSYRLGVGGPGYTGPQVDTTQWKTPDS
ncbi:MAG: hypothetical protein LC138_14555, partial [Anaerolineales bacterium]|nr:hypothetical protein [Anaerolineales bacterium]